MKSDGHSEFDITCWGLLQTGSFLYSALEPSARARALELDIKTLAFQEDR